MFDDETLEGSVSSVARGGDTRIR